jgi:hypothetical protein
MYAREPAKNSRKQGKKTALKHTVSTAGEI